MKRKTSLANLEGIPFLAMMWCMCIQACTNASIHACYFLVRLGQHLGLIGLDKGDRDIYRRGRTIIEISRSLPIFNSSMLPDAALLLHPPYLTNALCVAVASSASVNIQELVIRKSTLRLKQGRL